MLEILFGLVAGGTFYAGSKVYGKRKAFRRTAWRTWLQKTAPAIPVKTEPGPPNLALQQANQGLILSSVSLGLTTVGMLVQPAFGIIGMPIVLYLFAPTYRDAWHSLRSRRITSSVLDATRVTVCTVMGFYFVAALNASFQSLSKKWLAQEDAKFQQTLTTLLGQPPARPWVFVNGVEVATQPERITAGDVLVIAAGEAITLSGRVLYGSAWVDERLATGNLEAVHKGVGDTVFAATVVRSGQLYVLAGTPTSITSTGELQLQLEQVKAGKTLFQRVGEASGAGMAPLMWASFAFSWPLLGANHAAAFLTTSMGGYMHTLGPLAVQNFVALAAEQGILIKDGRVLERLNIVNTILIDEQILQYPAAVAQAKTLIHHLRQRAWPAQALFKHKFAIYLLSAGDEEATRKLVAEVGCDDYFIERTSAAKAERIEQLQLGGRMICYIGDGVVDAAAMQQALVSISLGKAATVSDAAQIMLPGPEGAPHIERLEALFTLAAQFVGKQSFSLLAPILLDVIDIGTTLLFHFDLVYSILFSYSGLLLSIANIRLTGRLEDVEPAPNQQSAAMDRLLDLAATQPG